MLSWELSVKDIDDNKTDFFVMLIVAVFAMWNIGVTFLVGVILFKKEWVKI
jgi:hypothetical protein